MNKLQVRDKELVFGNRTFIMGIVNVTPDSFSQDGILNNDAAVSYALEQIKKGADIIDIGGQSTRPGYKPIDEITEIKRIIPVISALRKVSNVIISVDTFSPAVWEQAIAAGADILNSIWGLTDDLLQLVKEKSVPAVIMHNNESTHYPKGVVTEVVDYFSTASKKAIESGLKKEQIILDPGIGFGKTPDQNLELLSHFKQISDLGFPTLIGTSRKSTIGKLTDRPVDQRVFGTAATVAYAIAQLVDIVRVHDIEEIADVVKVSDAIIRGWRPDSWQKE